jgi:hypothetical protein
MPRKTPLKNDPVYGEQIRHLRVASVTDCGSPEAISQHYWSIGSDRVGVEGINMADPLASTAASDVAQRKYARGR